MKWSFDQPKFGDMIRVNFNGLYHYGIFIDEDKIVQFGLAPVARRLLKDSEVEVLTSNVEQFLCGGFLEVGIPEKKDGKRRPPKKIVEYALSKLGQRGYSILYNNCEHFAYECTFGQKRCTQADDVREMFRSMPILDVYTAKIPDTDFDIDTIIPEERREEILSCGSDKVKREKFYAWALLKYALSRTFNYKMEDLVFERAETGKWNLPNCFFSISHSNDMVAVAVSRNAVGVDIEAVNPKKCSAIEKVLTKKEKKLFAGVCEEERSTFLTQKWTEKESIFKAGKNGKFRPAKLETAIEGLNTKSVVYDGVEYVLTVYSAKTSPIRYREQIKLD
ncbi:MAG: lecithin retinol acyltransferase family protein [Clostridia bacterium]|nr:lecithin retinol acyltransferase family protein [Clostridia bacterium]